MNIPFIKREWLCQENRENYLESKATNAGAWAAVSGDVYFDRIF